MLEEHETRTGELCGAGPGLAPAVDPAPPAAGAIGILGMACRLPGADSPEEFWRLSLSGRTAIRPMAGARWPDRFHHPDPRHAGTSVTDAAALLDDVWSFDPGFFGLSLREARQMDPQQRLALTVAWEALEAAGVTVARRRTMRIGVYAGCSASDHGQAFFDAPEAVDAGFMTGNTLSVVANRVSHCLDLRGPSLTLDTACSSALFALDAAATTLAAGRIDAAVVVGVHALLSPLPFIGFSRAGMLSPTGRLAAFGDGADGYVRGEGAVAVVLGDARAAWGGGGRIEALLAGTATGASGRTAGIARPDPARQAEVMAAALADACIAPDALAYVEAHGTGTPVGDPVEAEAIARAVAGLRRPLPISSAKAAIGHLEPAAGLAGLLRASLALSAGEVPPTAVERSSDAIDWKRLGLRLARTPEPIEPATGTPPAALVNAFGFGGANASAVLVRAPAPRRAPEVPPGAIVVTAPTAEGLARAVDDWRAALAARPAEAAAMASASVHRRTWHRHRAVAALAPGDDPAAALARARIGEARAEGGAVFVYCGNGGQHPGMGRALEADPVYRAARDRVADLFAALDPAQDPRRFVGDPDDALTGQPALLALQVGLTEALGARGLAPAAVLGHSVGEIAAAWASGALALEDAVRLVATRAPLVAALRGTGGMAAVAASAARIEDVIAGEGLSAVAVSGEMGPRSATVTGTPEALAALGVALKRARIAMRPLAIPYPYHSPALDPLEPAFRDGLGTVATRAPGLPFASSTLGRIADAPPDAEFWWRNLRGCVRLRQAVEALAEATAPAVLIEIGPRPLLGRHLLDTLGADGPAVLPGLSGPAGEETADDILAVAVAHGAAVEADRLAGPAFPDPGRLPPAPLAPVRLATPEDRPQAAIWRRATHPLLGTPVAGAVHVWERETDILRDPWLADHRAGGVAIMPAAWFVAVALAAARAAVGEGAALAGVTVLARLVVSRRSVTLRTRVEPAAALVIVESRAGEGPWTAHLTASLAAMRDMPVLSRPADGRPVAPEDLYVALSGDGLDYGPAFRRVAALEIGEATAITRLSPGTGDDAEVTALDAAIHALRPVIRATLPGVDLGDDLLLPAGAARIWRARDGEAVRAQAVLTAASGDGVTAEIALLDTAGRRLTCLEGLRLERVPGPGRRRAAGHWIERLVPLPAAVTAAPLPDEAAVLAALRAAIGLRDRSALADARLIADALLRRLCRDRLEGGDGPAPAGSAAQSARALLAGETGSACDPDPDAGTLMRALMARMPDCAGLLRAVFATAAAIDRPPPEHPPLPPAEAETMLASDLAAALVPLLSQGGPVLLCLPEGMTPPADPGDGVAVLPVPDGAPPPEGPFAGALRLSAMAAPAPWPGPGLLAADAPVLSIAPAGDPVDRIAPSCAGLPSIRSAMLEADGLGLEVSVSRAPAVAPAPGAAIPRLLATAETGEAAARLGAALAALGREAEILPPVFEDSRGLALLLDALRAAGPTTASPVALLASLAEPDGPAGAALAAFRRTVENEHGRGALALCRLSGQVGAEAALAALASGEPDTVVMPTGVRVPRFLPHPGPQPAPARAGASARRLALGRRGDPDSLCWRDATRREPGDGEIEIAVEAAGLNFRDVMWARAMLPSAALETGFAGTGLGLECAGLVVAAGAGAAFAPGARVLALAPSALASHVTVPSAAAAAAGDRETVACAALPVAALTAHQALGAVGRLAPGETVLIHGAAGGVGLAALGRARAIGARVFASAGTAHKRGLLRALGAEGVFDSRSTAFEAGVMAATGGRGVDLALNCLGGGLLRATLRCLGPGGRLVELGKRDILGDARIGLGALAENRALIGLDIDALAARPGALPPLAEALEGIGPLPVSVFGPAETARAMRMMADGAHVGKIVIRPETPAIRPGDPAMPSGGWIVTGGLSGLGLLAAERIVRAGGRRLWLVSRSGRAPEADADRLNALARTACIETAAIDIADASAVAALCADVAAAGGLAGVVHAAGLQDDASVATLDAGRIARVLAPKIDGARHLDRSTAALSPARFLLLGSLSARLGTPGQGAYAAANAALEGIARARRAAGRPAVCLSLGPVADAGILARDPALSARVAAASGGAMLLAAEVAELIDRAIAGAALPPALTLARLPTGRLAEGLAVAAGPLLARLRPAEAPLPRGERPLLSRLAGLDPAAARATLTAEIAGAVAEVLRETPGRVATARRLADSGLDSLMAMDLKLVLEDRLGAELPAALVGPDTTIDGLAASVQMHLEARAEVSLKIDLMHKHGVSTSDGAP